MLALDGGGVRGIVSLGYLEAIESLLRERYQRENLVLADYFDFIGGTSTGAIIAASLATGKAVENIVQLYLRLADHFFKKRFWRRGLLFAKFQEKALNAALKEQFGDMTFSDPAIQTGLVIMAKRWDTGSPWVVHNVHDSNYYRKYTNGYLVRQIVRASTAAPSYFRPERIEVKPGTTGAFVDGGVTPHNNPALQMLLLATLEGYGLEWEVGAEKLMIVSVGTGAQVQTRNPRSWKNRLAMANGITSLQMMMDDADALNRTLLQWLSDSPTAQEIDKEVGALSNDLLTGRPLITYLRYNALLNTSWLGKLGITVSSKRAKKLQDIDDSRNVDLLKDIGEKAAQMQVEASHFPGSFDV